MDLAMQPAQAGDFDALELFTATQAARAEAQTQRGRRAAGAGTEV